MEDIELEIFRQKVKEIEDLRRNAEKYIQLAKDIGRRYNAKVFIAGSYGTEKFSKASDLDVVLVVPNKNLIDKLLIELRRKIRNSRVNFHVITEDEKILYKLRKI